MRESYYPPEVSLPCDLHTIATIGIYSATVDAMSKMTIRPDRYPKQILSPKNAHDKKLR